MNSQTLQNLGDAIFSDIDNNPFLNELYDTNIEIANWGRVIHQECLLALQCVRIDNLTMTAKERYEALLKTFPDICQRVNLGYIASFLGISISTLSRIRAEK